MTEFRIWPATNGPDTSASDGQSISLGTEFYVTAQAWLTALRFYRGTTNVQPSNVRLYRVDSATTGTVVAEVTAPTFSGTGWQEYAITPALNLTINQRYRAVVHLPADYTATPGYWIGGGPGASGITNGILVAPNAANATAVDQGSFSYSPNPTFPTTSFNGGCYWVDVVVSDTAPTFGATADETVTAGPLSTRWSAASLSTTHAAGPLSTRWSAGRIQA